MRRDAGVDDRDADALTADARDRPDAQQPASDAGTDLIGRGRLIRHRHADFHQRIAREVIERGVGGDFGELGAIGRDHGAACQGAKYRDVMLCRERGERIRVAVHDHACARGGMAGDMSEEVVREVRTLVLGSTHSKRGNRYQSQNSRDMFKSHNMTQTILRVVHVLK